MSTPPPYPGAPLPGPVPGDASRGQHAAPGWMQPRFAPPQQFQPVPDAMLASQRSTRVATRALTWAIVACVVSAIPLLGLCTIAAAIPALQMAIAARVQRLAGGGRAVWAIVLASLSIVGSIGWTITWFVVLVALMVPGAATLV